MEGKELNEASELLQSLQKEYDLLLVKESELTFMKNKTVDQYNERKEVSSKANAIGKLIVYQANVAQALKGGGKLTVITDNYGESFVCPDLRKIPAEYYAFEEETILLNPKPDYIPDLGKDELRSRGYVFDSVRIEEDSYVIALNGFWYKKEPSKFRVDPETEIKKDNTFAILTLEQLVLTSQYYFVYAKAVGIKKAKEANERAREYFINKPEASRLWYYDQKNFYFSLPSKIQKQYTQEQWNALTLIEKEAIYVPVQRTSVKRIESKLDSNQMYVSLHKMYEAFVDSSALPPKEGFANNKVWEYWAVFREMMKWKINDLQVRSESDSEVRLIALETSFGDSGVNLQLRDTLGLFVKRQNGSDINIDDINQISEKWISLNNTFGILNKTAYDFGLKISHTGKTFVYASKASGMFIASRRAIAVSNKFGDSMFGYILAHEVGHFIDYTTGKVNGRRHASDNYESKAGVLANILKNNLNKKTDSKYTNATNECFARAMEQYFAISTTGDGAFHEYSAGKLYFEADEYVNKEVFYNQLKPAVEAFLKESSWIFGDITTAEKIDGEGEVEEQKEYTEINSLSISDISKNYTVAQMDELIQQLEGGMSDMLKSNDTVRANKLNELIGKVIDARNTLKSQRNEPIPTTDIRVPQEVEGRERKNDSLDEATRYIRDGIAASKEKQQGRLSGEEERRLEKALALEYAKANGIWITDFYSFGTHMEGGNENTLAYNYAEGMVYKSNNLSNYGYSIVKMLEGIKGHNEIFDCDKYEFVGFTGIENSNGSVYVEPVFKQMYMYHSDQASQPEIDAFMRGLGFLKTGDHSYENEKYMVADLRPRNVLKDENGNICVIDDIVKMKEENINVELIADHSRLNTDLPSGVNIINNIETTNEQPVEPEPAYTKSKIDGYTIEREKIDGGKTKVIVNKGGLIGGFVYPTPLYPDFISNEKAIEIFKKQEEKDAIASKFPAYSDAIKMPEGGAQAMDKFNFQAQGAQIIGESHGLRPSAVYDWANRHDVDLGSIGHIMSDKNNRDAVFSDIVNTNTYDKVKELVEGNKGADIVEEIQPEPTSSDREYFKEKLDAIKIAEKFADAEEKEYFRELKEAIKISLKYL